MYELGVILQENGLYSTCSEEGYLDNIYQVQLVPELINFNKIRGLNNIKIGG